MNHFPVLLITVAALMHPLQYDLRSSAAKDYACSRCAKQPWRSHPNAICKDWVAKHKRTTRNGVGNCSSKTGSRRQRDKKTILKRFLKGIFKGKLLAPKLRKSADKSLSQPWCSHSNTIYDVQLQKKIVLRMQPAAPSNLDAAIPMRSVDWVAKHNSIRMRNVYTYACVCVQCLNVCVWLCIAEKCLMYAYALCIRMPVYTYACVCVCLCMRKCLLYAYALCIRMPVYTAMPIRCIRMFCCIRMQCVLRIQPVYTYGCVDKVCLCMRLCLPNTYACEYF